MKKIILIVFCALATLAKVAPVHAVASSFDVNLFRPAVDSSPYFSLYDASILAPRDFSTSLAFDYAKKPLECNGCPQNDVVRHLMTGHYTFALGLPLRFEIGIDVPVVFYSQFFNETSGAETIDGSAGDILFQGKRQLFAGKRVPIAVALLPFITLPTGDPNRFLGNGAISGGTKISISGTVAKRLGIAANLGYRARDDVTRTSTRIDDEFLYGLGLSLAALRSLDLVAEAYGSTVLRDFAEQEAQSPLEALGGLRYRPRPDLSLTAGGGVGLVKGVGSPTFRSLFSLTFTPSRRHHPLEESPPAPPSP